VKIESRQLIEIIGIFGVIASLIFVGMQLLLDRRIAIAEVYASRAESYNETIRSYLESEDWLDLQENQWERGIRPSWWDESGETANLLRNNQITVRLIWVRVLESQIELASRDNLYFQNQKGLLEEEVWQTQRGIVKNALQGDEIDRLLYINTSRPIRALIDELIAEIEYEDKFSGSQ